MTVDQRSALMEALRLLAGTRAELAGNWSDRKLREIVRDTGDRLGRVEALLHTIALMERP